MKGKLSLFEYENQMFGDIWTEESIKELRRHEPKRNRPSILFPDVDRTDPNWNLTPDEYYCWQGSRIPCWFE